MTERLRQLMPSISRRGNALYLWWPHSLKMNGRCRDVTKGRLVQVLDDGGYVLSWQTDDLDL